MDRDLQSVASEWNFGRFAVGFGRWQNGVGGCGTGGRGSDGRRMDRDSGVYVRRVWQWRQGIELSERVGRVGFELVDVCH